MRIISLAPNVNIQQNKAKVSFSAKYFPMKADNKPAFETPGGLSLSKGTINVSNIILIRNFDTEKNINLENAKILGNIKSRKGKINLIDSTVEGKLTVGVDKLILKGKNTLLNLILKCNNSCKVPQFRLPSGNEIKGFARFESKKPGILYLEQGAKFSGRIFNGIVKHI